MDKGEIEIPIGEAPNGLIGSTPVATTFGNGVPSSSNSALEPVVTSVEPDGHWRHPQTEHDTEPIASVAEPDKTTRNLLVEVIVVEPTVLATPTTEHAIEPTASVAEPNTTTRDSSVEVISVNHTFRTTPATEQGVFLSTERKAASVPPLIESQWKNGNAPPVLKLNRDQRMFNYATTLTAANNPFNQARAYIPYAGSKYQIRKILQLGREGKGMPTWENKDVVDRLAKLFFFIKHQVSEEHIGKLVFIPSDDEDEDDDSSQLFRDEMKRLQASWRGQIRKYLDGKTKNINHCRNLNNIMPLKEVDEAARADYLEGWWDADPKKEAMEMWKPIADVVNWDIIFSPPNNTFTEDRRILRKWRDYLRNCFIESMELHLKTDHRGGARTFYRDWSEMTADEGFEKCPGIIRVPVCGSIQTRQVWFVKR